MTKRKYDKMTEKNKNCYLKHAVGSKFSETDSTAGDKLSYIWLFLVQILYLLMTKILVLVRTAKKHSNYTKACYKTFKD